MEQSWQSTVVAVAMIALVGVMFWRATEGDFAEIWAGVGTVVGVITGAVPSYFFRADAKQAQAKADAIAGESPEALQAARARNPGLFG